MCANFKNDRFSGNKGNEENEWIVYLVEMNENLRLCPLKGCGLPLKCPICDERWERKRDLDKHLRKHHLKKEQQRRKEAFTCQCCKGSFNDHWNRLAHEKRCNPNKKFSESE